MTRSDEPKPFDAWMFPRFRDALALAVLRLDELGDKETVDRIEGVLEQK
jgi:hypothetical protein